MALRAGPRVHKLDAVVLFRLAVEKGKAGATYNAVAEEGVPVREIVEVIGRKVGVPVEGRTVEQVQEAMGLLAHLVGMDGPTSSEKTRRELGWAPVHVGLLEDMETNYLW